MNVALNARKYEVIKTEPTFTKLQIQSVYTLTTQQCFRPKR